MTNEFECGPNLNKLIVLNVLGSTGFSHTDFKIYSMINYIYELTL